MWRKTSLVLGAAAILGLSAPENASACGGFFARRTMTVPSLQVEQVLLIHDPLKEEEHFVRELVFRDAKEPFGFVVPTPGQPKVAKVDVSPFNALAAHFPPEPPSTSGGGPGLRGLAGGGKGGGAGAAPVTVISQERIGSFTVFVLAATDAGALKKWLDDNQLTTTTASEAWLAHYVKLGFYYAAFRYEMPASKDAGANAKSETVRISFPTPLPYYPYKEPEHVEPRRDRVLAVWFVSPVTSVPVATYNLGGASWKQPWAEPMKHSPQSRAELVGVVGADLGTLLGPPTPEPAGAPARVWQVQTFEDQKTNRRGWGDIVLVPAAPRPGGAKALEKMEKLIASLEPTGGAR